MSQFFVWPRMDQSTAEKRFREVTLESGPEIDTKTSNYDFSSVGERKDTKELGTLRDQLVEIAETYGFRRRRGFDQEIYPDDALSKKIDREFTLAFRELTPMRWAEAGSREVWSWFSLAFLPDLTHWRWKKAVETKTGEREGQWYKPRWIGSDLTRHTWARYWWRSVQFESDPELLSLLQEHDFNHLIERADTIGANPYLMANFGRQLLELKEELEDGQKVSRRVIFDESAKRMRRRLAFVDDAILSEGEISDLVSEFVEDTKKMLTNSSDN